MIKRILRNIDVIAMGILLCTIFFVMFMEVCVRTFGGKSFSWSAELCRVCFIWFSLFALFYNIRRENNVRLTVFFSQFPRFFKLVVLVFIDLIMLVTFLIIIPSTGNLVGVQRKVLTTAMRMPRSYLSGAALVCFILSVLMCVYDIYHQIVKYKNGEEL